MASELPLARASLRLRGRPGRPRRDKHGDTGPRGHRQVPMLSSSLSESAGASTTPRLLSRADAARYLGVGTDTVDRLRMRGELQRVALCGLRRVLFDKTDLDRLIERSRG